MKKATLVVMALALLLPLAAMAQNTSNGSLTVSATVQSSIYLTVEQPNTGNVAALTGTGTNAATLAFGTVSAYGGTTPSGVTEALVGSGSSTTAFTLSTAFGIKVTEFNAGSSVGYTLTAELGSADAHNTWTVDGSALNNTTPTTISGGTGYGSIVNHSFVLQVPVTLAAGSISNTVNFVATQS